MISFFVWKYCPQEWMNGEANGFLTSRPEVRMWKWLACWVFVSSGLAVNGNAAAEALSSGLFADAAAGIAGESVMCAWRAGAARLIVLFALLQIAICDSFYYVIQDEWIAAAALAGLLGRPAEGCETALICAALTLLIGGGLAALPRPPLGFGDVKLFCALAFGLSPPDYLRLITFAFLFSGAFATIKTASLLLTKDKQRSRIIAFGPFIALAYYALFAATL